MPAAVPSAVDPARSALVAGEASGDLLAGLLLDGLQARWPGLRAQGIGGPQMQQRGFEAWWPSERLALHGYSLELLQRLWELVRMLQKLRARLLAERPAVFIGVDAPRQRHHAQQHCSTAGPQGSWAARRAVAPTAPAARARAARADALSFEAIQAAAPRPSHSGLRARQGGHFHFCW